MKKLVIPPHLKKWIKPAIAGLDGKALPVWTQEFIDTGWLVDVPEPVVLSAEEIIREEYSHRDTDYNNFDGEWSNICVKSALKRVAEIADKNGQLREYYSQEQVELREAAEDLFIGGSVLRVTDALENLKPPHERDND